MSYSDYGYIDIHNLAKVWVATINIKSWKDAHLADYLTCDIK
jgi:hypothetical protein